MAFLDELDGITEGVFSFLGGGKRRELMQAAVANIVAFAHVDGSYGTAEQAQVAKVLAHKIVAKFDREEVKAFFTKMAGNFSIGAEIGLEDCEAELLDLKGEKTPEAERHMVMLLGLSVAKAEGGNELGAEEKAWAVRAAQALALDPKKYVRDYAG